MSIRHALLALLSEGPKDGLQLGQEFEAGNELEIGRGKSARGHYPEVIGRRIHGYFSFTCA